MQRQYSEATKENGLLEFRLEAERTACAVAEDRVRELEERLAEAEANVAGKLISCFL